MPTHDNHADRSAVFVGLTAEVVNNSDQCPGCGHLYLTPEARDPRTDKWAWRKCPTAGCRFHTATVVYPGDWERRARARVVQLETALRLVLDVAAMVEPQHGDHAKRIADKLKEITRAALPDPRTGECPACESMPTGTDGRAAFCAAHRDAPASKGGA